MYKGAAMCAWQDGTPWARVPPGTLDMSSCRWHPNPQPTLFTIRAPDNIPLDIHVEYYTQRATKGGLLISEGTIISDR